MPTGAGAMGELDGKIALVTEGGTALGRAVAVALAARGVRVVVFGAEERPLGETVGEIAYQGGKARHVVGDVRSAEDSTRAAAKCLEIFGALDVVVASFEPETGSDAFSSLMRATLPHVPTGGRVVIVGTSAGDAWERALSELVRASSRELASHQITCNAVAAKSSETDADDVGELVSWVCARGARRLTGQILCV